MRAQLRPRPGITRGSAALGESDGGTSPGRTPLRTPPSKTQGKPGPTPPWKGGAQGRPRLQPQLPKAPPWKSASASRHAQTRTVNSVSTRANSARSGRSRSLTTSCNTRQNASSREMARDRMDTPTRRPRSDSRRRRQPSSSALIEAPRQRHDAVSHTGGTRGHEHSANERRTRPRNTRSESRPPLPRRNVQDRASRHDEPGTDNDAGTRHASTSRHSVPADRGAATSRSNTWMRPAERNTETPSGSAGRLRRPRSRSARVSTPR